MERRDFAILLKGIRARTELTQQEFAEAIGYARATVAAAESTGACGTRFVEAIQRRFPEEFTSAMSADTASAVLARFGPMDTGGDTNEMFSSFCTQRPELAGNDWFALWESTADREVVLNTEPISIQMNRRTGRFVLENLERSREHIRGGYLWRAEGYLFDSNHLLSTYIAREPGVLSKGTLYLVLHNSGRFIEGQWIGCSYDGEWARGLVTMSRSRDQLPSLLRKLRTKIPSLPYNTLLVDEVIEK